MSWLPALAFGFCLGVLGSLAWASALSSRERSLLASMLLFLVLLLPAVVRAQPAGVPAEATYCGTSCGVSVPDALVFVFYQVGPADAVCGAPLVGSPWGDVVGPAGTGFDPSMCSADGYASFVPVLDEGAGWWYVVRDAEPPAPPGELFSWDNPAHVLQLLLWGGVPLIGFFGYSMGARE